MNGFHATSCEEDIKYIEKLLDELNKGIFLDLGSGEGKIVHLARAHAWKAYGIELNKDICSKEKNICHGSFFPDNFEVKRIENNISEDPFHDKFAKVSFKTPIDYDKVDLFYHFQVERQDNILRLFSKYAKSCAHLLFNQTIMGENYSVPTNVVEISRTGKRPHGAPEGHLILYKKI